MSGKHGGVQALISQHVKRDVPYVHCFNHQLHLVVVHVCNGLPVVRGYFDVCNLLSKFLAASKVSVMYKKFGGDAMARLVEQRWSGHYKTTQCLLKNLLKLERR